MSKKNKNREMAEKAKKASAIDAKKNRFKSREELRTMVYAALFLALAFLLPFLTANSQQIATALSPMHIPAFLCGFICGPGWGAAMGFCAPLLRSVIVGMPHPPMAVCMAFELAVYGFAAGLMHRLLPKKIPFVYVSLVVSMLLGRIAFCLVGAKMLDNMAGKGFFVLLGQQFVNTWIGILIHLAIVPPIVLAVENYRKKNR